LTLGTFCKGQEKKFKKKKFNGVIRTAGTVGRSDRKGRSRRGIGKGLLSIEVHSRGLARIRRGGGKRGGEAG